MLHYQYEHWILIKITLGKEGTDSPLCTIAWETWIWSPKLPYLFTTTENRYNKGLFENIGCLLKFNIQIWRSVAFNTSHSSNNHRHYEQMVIWEKRIPFVADLRIINIARVKYCLYSWRDRISNFPSSPKETIYRKKLASWLKFILVSFQKIITFFLWLMALWMYNKPRKLQISFIVMLNSSTSNASLAIWLSF